MDRSRVGIILSVAALLLLPVVSEALVVTTARVVGGAIEVTGRGSAPNALLTWDGRGVGIAGRNGAFRFSTTALPPSCVGQLSDGVNTTAVAVQGCGPQGPAGPMLASVVDANGRNLGGVIGTDEPGSRHAMIPFRVGEVSIVLRVGRHTISGNVTNGPYFASDDCSGNAYLFGPVGDDDLMPRTVVVGPGYRVYGSEPASPTVHFTPRSQLDAAGRCTGRSDGLTEGIAVGLLTDLATEFTPPFRIVVP